MAASSLQNVVHHLRLLAANGLTNRQLLAEFIATGDEAAFAALVRRHGRLVFAVSRRVLGPGPDIDDVFQATFVVLSRKASSIRNQNSVASWLYGVAYRLAMKVRKRRAHRRRHEQPAESFLDQVAEKETMLTNPESRTSLSELGLIVDNEMQRLPADCRDAVVTCLMQGLGHAEAAKQLGWPLGTLKTRLQRGRELLRERLERRGVGLSAVALSVVLAEQAQRLVPLALTRATIERVTQHAVSATVAALANAAVRTLTAAKVAFGLCAAIAVSAISVGTAVFPFTSPAVEVPVALPDVIELQVEQPAAPKDFFGDPLPQGALARLGTVRWRHSDRVTFIAFSEDGKVLVTAGEDRLVRVWEYPSGKQVYRIGPGPRAEAQAAFGPARAVIPHVTAAVSRDGTLLATRIDESVVSLWDVATGKKVGTIPCDNDKFYAYALAFAPDGKRLAIANKSEPVRLWDIETAKVVREFGKVRKPVTVMADIQTTALYAPDGKTLVSVTCEMDEQNAVNSITFWDPETGQEMHTVKVKDGFGIHSPVFSPDSKLFAYATHDCEVHLLRAATGENLQNFKVLAIPGHWPRLVFAADSSKLYSKSPNPGMECIQEWDVKTGKLLRRMFSAGVNPQDPDRIRYLPGLECLATSADGKTLAAGGGDDHSIRFYDLATGELLPAPPGHCAAVDFLTFTSDGKSLVTRGTNSFRLPLIPRFGTQATYHLWDGASGKHVDKLPLELASTVAYLPDQSAAVLYHVPSGKERCRVAIGEGGTKKATLFFSPDQQLLASYAPSGSLAIHDATTGKLVRKLELLDSIQTPQDGANAMLRGAAFSPDSRMLALDYGDGLIRLVEVASGKVRLSQGKQYAVGPEAMMPGGETTSYHYGKQWSGEAGSSTVAFSPDSRLIAYAALDNALHIFGVATGQPLARFDGHTGLLGAVAFAPDGRSVATTSNDTTALIWDVRGFSVKAGPAPRRLDPPAVNASWDNLTADNAAVGNEAINGLIASPREAVPFLNVRLKPVAAVDPLIIAELTEQLDSSDFKIRQKAQAELLTMDDQVLPHLEKMARQLPLETRQRLEAFQTKLAAPLTGDRLREVRAIEVLERIGNAEACQLLEALAGGAPGAVVTAEAQSALWRRTKRNTDLEIHGAFGSLPLRQFLRFDRAAEIPRDRKIFSHVGIGEEEPVLGPSSTGIQALTRTFKARISRKKPRNRTALPLIPAPPPGQCH
jgi:RNA polymerase sigma factor (sigma-70 family)